MAAQKTDICPVYLLYGPEEYLLEREVQDLLNQTLSMKERGFNVHLFQGGEHSGQEIVQTAQTLPMFSKYRFVLISDAEDLNEKDVEALMGYIRKPSLSTCLVLQSQAIGPWKQHRKEIEETGKVIEYKRLKGKALISWMKNRMKEKGKILSDESADYMIEITGDHLSDLENAMEKAFLSVGEKKTIGLSDLGETLSEVRASTIYDLTEAIGQKKLEKAIGILGKAMESRAVTFKKDEVASKFSDPTPVLLSMMAKQYWSMLVIKQMSSRHRNADDLAGETGANPWLIKKLLDQSRNFSEASLKEGIRKCHQTDLAMKRSGGPKEILMEKLVIDLCRPGTLFLK